MYGKVMGIPILASSKSSVVDLVSAVTQVHNQSRAWDEGRREDTQREVQIASLHSRDAP